MSVCMAERERISAAENDLAVAFKSGRLDIFPLLLECVRPLVRMAVFKTMQHRLPALLDREDIDQQAVCLVATLARKWSPDAGDFGAYLRTVLPWELWRYARSFAPGKRSAGVRVGSIPHDTLATAFAGRPGDTDEQWSDRAYLSEALARLRPLDRRVFLLHVRDDLPFEVVARVVGISVAQVYRQYRFALDGLRAADPDVPIEATRTAPLSDDAVERVVRALHALKRPSGALPGRVPVCRSAGMSEPDYHRAMRALTARGCILDRSGRKAGRLAHATADETVRAYKDGAP